MALQPPTDHHAEPRDMRSQSGFLKLPHELIEAVISQLPVNAVAKLGATCKRLHLAVQDDVLWKKRFLSIDVFDPGDSPDPYPTWRDLYLAHYPFWFIPQRRIWYADGTEQDGGFCGKLLIARYQPHTGSIEAYDLVGERGQNNVYEWADRPGVSIHDFHPRVRLHLAQPVIRLRGDLSKKEGTTDVGGPKTNNAYFGSAVGKEQSSRGLKVICTASNELNLQHHIFSKVMLARSILPEHQHFSMRLWPPDRLPAIDRVRRLTPSVFAARSQRSSFDAPTKHEDVCQTAFRFQRQFAGRIGALFNMLNYGAIATFGRNSSEGGGYGDGGINMTAGMATGIATYATLPEDAYRPTPERPYQGVWVGDYATHGCEFLLVRQKITKEEIAGSERFGPKVDTSLANRGWPILVQDFVEPSDDEQTDGADNADVEADDNQGESDSSAYSDAVAELDDVSEGEEYTMQGASSSSSVPPAQQSTQERRRSKRRRFHSASEGVPEPLLGETGRLEAIKLTGDPNVPRGEFTFVAEEIGRKGEIYVARSEPFNGSRAVQCWGHIAADGFTDDLFVKTDLILVSHDCLAQYWHQFGHVAFYRRVDVDSFFDPLTGVSEIKL